MSHSDLAAELKTATGKRKADLQAEDARRKRKEDINKVSKVPPMNSAGKEMSYSQTASAKLELKKYSDRYRKSGRG